MDGAEPKSLLQQLFEQAAAALDLDVGVHALVVRLVDGELVAWGSGHDDRRSPAELVELDGRITWMKEANVDPRRQLEDALQRLVRQGHIPGEGQREVVFRIDEDGHVRWFEARGVRVPASVLERGFDETGV